jgi:hypothetical protein
MIRMCSAFHWRFCRFLPFFGFPQVEETEAHFLGHAQINNRGDVRPVGPPGSASTF